MGRSRFLLLVIVFCLPVFGCECGGDSRPALNPRLSLLSPKASQLKWGRVDIEAEVQQGLEAVSWVEFELSPSGKDEFRTIGSIPKPPFSFRWQSVGVKDGFYKIRAVAYDGRQNAYSSQTILFQVHNEPPRLWFVNCKDGIWIRGKYPLVVDKQREDPEWVQPPVITVNGASLSSTLSNTAPYHYQLDTSSMPDGEVLQIRASVKDIRGREATIRCRASVDNTPPRLAFVRPHREDAIIGLRFQTQFQAFDEMGVERVQLWVDSAACASPDNSKPGNLCANQNLWQSLLDPYFRIPVVLSDNYKSLPELTPVQLKAVAIDKAGNRSYPPTTLQVLIDPKPPEITIQRPSKNKEVLLPGPKGFRFCAEIRDSRLSVVEFVVTGGGVSVPIFSSPKTSGTTVLLPVYEICQTVSDPVQKFGFGLRRFLVRAMDQAGNISESSQVFRVGCGDSTDCPEDQFCASGHCRKPAGLGQPCDAAIPCDLNTKCVLGPSTNQTFCSSAQQSYCRKRCNPGNRFLEPDSCSQGFYCSRVSLACVPGDSCDPETQTGCGSNEQCILQNKWASICLPIGTRTEGATCSADCDKATNCSRGMWCVLDLRDLKKQCRRFCKQRSDCRAGERCETVSYAFGGKKVPLGVCLP